MRRAFTLAAAVVVALTAAGIALSKDPSSKPEDRVYGGYHSEGTFSGGLTLPPRDASVDAHSPKNGKAYGTFRLGRNDAAEFIIEGRVTCVSAVGNKVVVGGRVAAAGPGFTQFVGEDFLWSAIDNGGPGAAVRDRVGAAYVDADGTLGGVSFSGTLPHGWPASCPAADAAIAQDTFGQRDAQGGDIVVIDGT